MLRLARFAWLAGSTRSRLEQEAAARGNKESQSHNYIITPGAQGLKSGVAGSLRTETKQLYMYLCSDAQMLRCSELRDLIFLDILGMSNRLLLVELITSIFIC
jgi:hypothetical protein